MWKEFKKFALKGNVLDLAVGVIIGAAFGKIVSSLVNDVIMPVIGLITAGVDFKSLTFILKPAILVGGIITKPAVAIAYGSFLQNVFDFLIIAFTIFLLVRALNFRRIADEKKAAAEKARLDALAPKVITTNELLIEIRDLLKREKETKHHE